MLTKPCKTNDRCPKCDICCKTKRKKKEKTENKAWKEANQLYQALHMIFQGSELSSAVEPSKTRVKKKRRKNMTAVQKQPRKAKESIKVEQEHPKEVKAAIYNNLNMTMQDKESLARMWHTLKEQT
jgi:hypothetical protein